MTLTLITTILGIHILGLISPGPDFILCLNESLKHGRKAGFYTAVGIGLGIIVHIGYCLLGLGTLISESILLFSLIKTAGGLYLLYLGYKALQSTGYSATSDHLIENTGAQHSHRFYIKQGFLTNLLNPKATVFFVSLFALLLSGNPTPVQVSLISLFMMGTAVLWFSIVSILLTQKPIQTIYIQYSKYIDKIFGGMLVYFGYKLITSK